MLSRPVLSIGALQDRMYDLLGKLYEVAVLGRVPEFEFDQMNFSSIYHLWIVHDKMLGHLLSFA